MTGSKKGQLSCNPLGCNPSDLWSFSNVKHNHPEKTDHPCQFPLALVERCILSMTKEGDYVVDPFVGSGTTLIASLLNKRKSLGADKELKYIDIAADRIEYAMGDKIL